MGAQGIFLEGISGSAILGMNLQALSLQHRPHHGDRDLGYQGVEPTREGPPVGPSSFQHDLKLGLREQSLPKACRPWGVIGNSSVWKPSEQRWATTQLSLAMSTPIHVTAFMMSSPQ
jgi:hypothetical protein